MRFRSSSAAVQFLVFVMSATAFTVSERPRRSLVGLSTLAVGLLAYRLQRRKQG
jgi:uncharacterized membrane protein (DUF4010 family)